MIKAVLCFKRKSGMELAAFQDYWLNTHADVVRNLAGVRRYVQSHARLAGYRRGELVHDGIAELWFDDIQAMHDLAGTAALAAVEADEAEFISPEGRVFLLLDEHPIKDGPAPADGVKNIEFINRREGLTVEEFQRYWRDVHGPIAARIPVLRRYVQSHVRPGGYKQERQPAYDGLAITWFDSTDAMRASAATEEYRATRADEPNFLPDGEIPIIITKEHVIIG